MQRGHRDRLLGILQDFAALAPGEGGRWVEEGGMVQGGGGGIGDDS